QAGAQAAHLPTRRLHLPRLRRAHRTHPPPRDPGRRADRPHRGGAAGRRRRCAGGRDRRLPACRTGARGPYRHRMGRAAGTRDRARDAGERRYRGACGGQRHPHMSAKPKPSGAWPDATPRRVMLVAGEASGDLHAADLLGALRQQRPGLQVFGIGGPHLRAMGMETLIDAADVATVGATEAIGRLRTLLRAYRRLAAVIREDPPDLCIFVDFPEFNLRMAHLAKRQGIPVLYYIGPQVWAWRRGRVRKVVRRVDRLAVVFPFEASLYAHGAHAVEFVGHPLLDRVRVTSERGTTLKRHGLDPR